MDIELVYVECPHCGKWYTHSEILSYTTHGSSSEFWSDGKCEETEYSEYSFRPYTRCEKCDNFFWYDDCRKVKRHEIFEYADQDKHDTNHLVFEFLKANPAYLEENETISTSEYPPPHYWHSLPEYLIPDYLVILKTKNLNTERELYIRTKLWQHINDLVRDNKSAIWMHLQYTHSFKAFFNFSAVDYYKHINNTKKELYKQHQKLRIENLERLQELTQTTENEDDALTLIEIERELANFSKAKSLIRSLSSEYKKHYNNFIRKSLRRIKWKSEKVFKIS